MKIIYEINPKINETLWQEFVLKHPLGNFYHLPSWQKVLKNTFGYELKTIFAFEGNALVGILPLILVKSWLTSNRLVSLPFSYIVGPLATNEEVEKGLFEKAKKLAKEEKVSYLELRSEKEFIFPGFSKNDYYSTYVLELSKDEDVLWKKLDKGSVRWAINKAKKFGLKVEKKLGKNIEVFFRLNQKSKHKLGVPGHPIKLFSNLAKYFPNELKIYIAKIKNQPIAGIVTLSFKNKVVYAYGATDSEFEKYQANNLLVWEAIKDSAKNYSFFDFGRTSPENSGLISFKKHWGTKEQKLYYYFYPRDAKSLSMERSSRKFKLVTKIWQNLPESLTILLSNILFKHFD